MSRDKTEAGVPPAGWVWQSREGRRCNLTTDLGPDLVRQGGSDPTNNPVAGDHVCRNTARVDPRTFWRRSDGEAGFRWWRIVESVTATHVTFYERDMNETDPDLYWTEYTRTLTLWRNWCAAGGGAYGIVRWGRA